MYDFTPSRKMILQYDLGQQFLQYSLNIDSNYADHCHECYYKKFYCLRSPVISSRRPIYECFSPCFFDQLKNPRKICQNRAKCVVRNEDHGSFEPSCLCEKATIYLFDNQIISIPLYKFTGKFCEIKFIPIIAYLFIGFLIILSLIGLAVISLIIIMIKRRQIDSHSVNSFDYDSYFNVENNLSQSMIDRISENLNLSNFFTRTAGGQISEIPRPPKDGPPALNRSTILNFSAELEAEDEGKNNKERNSSKFKKSKASPSKQKQKQNQVQRTSTQIAQAQPRREIRRKIDKDGSIWIPKRDYDIRGPDKL